MSSREVHGAMCFRLKGNAASEAAHLIGRVLFLDDIFQFQESSRGALATLHRNRRSKGDTQNRLENRACRGYHRRRARCSIDAFCILAETR